MLFWIIKIETCALCLRHNPLSVAHVYVYVCHYNENGDDKSIAVRQKH